MMPIGVPKVAYRVPGSQSADWCVCFSISTDPPFASYCVANLFCCLPFILSVIIDRVVLFIWASSIGDVVYSCLYCRVDIYNRLYRERIIFLGSEIDDELANQVIGVMLYLDSEDSDKPIYLYINSPGGSVISGLAIYDCMQHIKSEVITINLGLAASMASFILAAGSKGKRLALPSSRIMIHQPMGGARGQAQDIKVEAAQIMRIRDNLVKMYSMMTGQTQDQIVKDLDRDNFMSAQEAADYGLVDRVLDYTKSSDTQL
jgi:ATP-dependent Clp protease, protease subunit